ncbi:MAG: Na+/H+ antiporter NhaC family protein [Prevotella sp.]|nr:Na+/H+ antiporter NhaC family protein [Prevotella sp.]MBO5204798.1 Na+/H+ antiporter NhaC family protein [Prevotella sp.]
MRHGIKAISPLLVFILFYLATSIVVGDFYKIPIIVGFLVSCVYGIIISTGRPLAKRIDTFSQGAGSQQIIQMIWIFVFAGAFASSAKAIGCIDATVNLTLYFLPANMLLAGLFIAACFVSLSVGTSVGTIVTLVPIAAGVAQQTGFSQEMIVAVVVGGAFFGDNLSFISDTTIVATSSQGCRLSDKFKANILIVLPAAMAILLLYIIIGADKMPPVMPHEIEPIKVLPYLTVLLAALYGLNVMVVLAFGIALTGAIGIINGDYDIFGWFSSINTGVTSMGELIIVTMLAGGLLALIKENGGIDFIIHTLIKGIKSKRGAEFAIVTLVGIVDICTANNTVAILTVGGLVRRVSERYGIDPRRAASLLDTASCCVQGIIPYGAQILMAAGLSSVAPMGILAYLYYPYCLLVMLVIAIIFRFPRRYCR